MNRQIIYSLILMIVTLVSATPPTEPTRMNIFERTIAELNANDVAVEFGGDSSGWRAVLEISCPVNLKNGIYNLQQIHITEIPGDGPCGKIVWDLYVRRPLSIWRSQQPPTINQVVFGAESLSNPLHLSILLGLINSLGTDMHVLELGLMIEADYGATFRYFADIPQAAVQWYRHQLVASLQRVDRDQIRKFRASYAVIRVLFGGERFSEFWTLLYSWSQLRELALWNLYEIDWFEKVFSDERQWSARQLTVLCLQWYDNLQVSSTSWLAGQIYGLWRSSLHTLALFGPDAPAVGESLGVWINHFSQLRRLILMDPEGQRLMDFNALYLKQLFELPYLNQVILPLFPSEDINIELFQTTIAGQLNVGHEFDLWFPCVGHADQIATLWRTGLPNSGCFSPQDFRTASMALMLVESTNFINGGLILFFRAPSLLSQNYPLDFLLPIPVIQEAFQSMTQLHDPLMTLSSLQALGTATENGGLSKLELIQITVHRGMGELGWKVERLMSILCNNHLKRAVIEFTRGTLIPYQILPLIDALKESEKCELEMLSIELSDVDFQYPQARTTFISIIKDLFAETRLQNVVITVGGTLNLRLQGGTDF